MLKKISGGVNLEPQPRHIVVVTFILVTYPYQARKQNSRIKRMGAKPKHEWGSGRKKGQSGFKMS